ncbi:PQQ-binding-like beta-propeller repeat protein [Streptomyces sp. NPDC001741]|uniref:outer membrane protein assembly factor BamB family protein n=1 Tax=Streptomyces sp. NPDC001741 TaxID=3364605 RepID=UPI0036C4CA08
MGGTKKPCPLQGTGRERTKGDVLMTQPPGQQQPPRGGFGAPYDPPPGTQPPPPPQPGNGPQSQPNGPWTQPDPQQPGPYGQQPGPYTPAYPQQPGPYAQQPQQPQPYPQQPGPYGQQAGYGYPPQPPTVAAPPATGGPGSGGGRRKGRARVLIGAALAVVLLAGGGIWLATGDGGGGKKPVAGPSDDGKKPTASPTSDDETFAGPTAAELNAGRKPGEAKVAWIQENGVDLPQYGEETHGPWFGGDVIAKGMYRKVSGYAVDDGAEQWSLRLPTDLCASPTAPTADGKVVVGIEDNVSESEASCSVLQMIDLRTGKAGWKKTVDRSALQDGLSHVAMSISGDTVTFGRDTASNAFRVSDGKELFGKREGVCQPFAFTGGERMLAAVSCQAEPADPVRQQVQEVDPVTGAPKWTYELKSGWSVAHIYSTSPPVISIKQPEKWAVVVLNDNGTYRSQLVGEENYGVRCGEESVQTGSNLDGCAGVAADASRLYLSTLPEDGSKTQTNKVVAFDLATGKSAWKAPAPAGRLMFPLRMEGGKVLVHVQSVYREGGEIGTLAPSAGTYATLLKHPASAAETENSLFVPRVAYRDGRSYLLPQRISQDEDEEEKAATAVLVYGE